MKKGKGDSGKAYHVRKEQKRKKKQDKEIEDYIDWFFTGRRKTK
jgi:hypothetical protein